MRKLKNSPVVGGTEGTDFWAQMNEEKGHHLGGSTIDSMNGKYQSLRQE